MLTAPSSSSKLPGPSKVDISTACTIGDEGPASCRGMRSGAGELGRGEAGAGDPLVGLGAATACREASRTHSWASCAFSFPFSRPDPAFLSNRAHVFEAPDPILARPSPRPAFFFGEDLTKGAGASSSSVGFGPSPVPRLFLRAKYPDGLRKEEEGRGADAPAAGGWKGAFLLGDRGFGFAVVDIVSSAGAEAICHLSATAGRFEGLGRSKSIFSISLAPPSVVCRGRLLGDLGAIFFGLARATEGANAAENPFDGDEGAETGALPFDGEATRGVKENGTGIVDCCGRTGAEKVGVGLEIGFGGGG